VSVNFNSTSPAAPSGTTNVSFQSDGSGNISANVPNGAINTTPINLTAQAANITTTTILTPSASGVYRVSAYIIVSQAATVSSTLPSTTITWTDPDNSTSQSITLTPTNTGNLLTTYQQASVIFNAKTGIPIQYSTASYATSGATPMQYGLRIRTEQL
jgi:flagellar basal body P-ring protein FlgI